MGVSGTGKTTIGELVAEALGIDFVEGDSHHPDANVRKMSEGEPLDDDDRRPWLEELGRVAAGYRDERRDVVITCSALKRAYRDLLREAVPDIFFVHLHAERDVLAERMTQRTKHFMPTSLLQSQLDTLQPLEPDERGAVVDVAPRPSRVASVALEEIAASCG